MPLQIVPKVQCPMGPDTQSYFLPEVCTDYVAHVVVVFDVRLRWAGGEWWVGGWWVGGLFGAVRE